MKLTRSRDDVIVSGVLAGLGEYFKVDPTLIRIGVAILIFFGAPFVIPIYFIGAVLIPKAPKKESQETKWKKKKTRNDKNTNKFDEQPSSKINDIEEDDWSDF